MVLNHNANIDAVSLIRNKHNFDVCFTLKPSMENEPDALLKPVEAELA